MLEASRILTASPIRNGNTQAVNAYISVLPDSIINQIVPKRYATAVPIAMPRIEGSIFPFPCFINMPEIMDIKIKPIK